MSSTRRECRKEGETSWKSWKKEGRREEEGRKCGDRPIKESSILHHFTGKFTARNSACNRFATIMIRVA